MSHLSAFTSKICEWPGGLFSPEIGREILEAYDEKGATLTREEVDAILTNQRERTAMSIIPATKIMEKREELISALEKRCAELIEMVRNHGPRNETYSEHVIAGERILCAAADKVIAFDDKIRGLRDFLDYLESKPDKT